MDYRIANIDLHNLGQQRIDWAAREMPVLKLIKGRLGEQRPLEGIRISACLHVTSETANLILTLKAGGAKVRLCASNPLSTQDEIASALVRIHQVPVFAVRGESSEDYYSDIASAVSFEPHITIDDGADLTCRLHTEHCELLRYTIGGTEETTTGVLRLQNLEKAKLLRYPIVAVNDAYSKYLFDNRYGTGQSTIDGILRATNLLLAGKNFVVCGYGWCGKGLAMRANGMGANVIVCEVDPLKALEATMEGFQVMKLIEAAKVGDVFVTVSGNINVITKKHFQVMKDGAVLANSGHFNVEIDIGALKALSTSVRRIKPLVDEYTLSDGRKLYLLAEGRLINLSAAEGHPAAVMDLGFANQALAVEYLVKNKGKLSPQVYRMPEELDKEVAKLKLSSMGIKIDELTKEQRRYLSSWTLGT